MKGYVARKGNCCYAVIYEGTDAPRTRARAGTPRVLLSLALRWSHPTGATHTQWSHATGGRQSPRDVFKLDDTPDSKATRPLIFIRLQASGR